MYVLEYKQLYIPREPITKNRTFQSYRWKQYAICDRREPLEQFISQQDKPDEWRIEPMADNVKR